MLRIVAGSQTGADRAALRAARAAGLSTAGVAPQGFRTERGPAPELSEQFGLVACDGGHAAADRANVAMSDALLAFRCRVPQTGRGCEMTVNYARRGKYAHVPLEWPPAHVTSQQLRPAAKPVLVMWDLSEDNAQAAAAELAAFLEEHRVRSLMVSGPCESTNPAAARAIEAMLTGALSVAAAGSSAAQTQHRASPSTSASAEPAAAEPAREVGLEAVVAEAVDGQKENQRKKVSSWSGLCSEGRASGGRPRARRWKQSNWPSSSEGAVRDESAVLLQRAPRDEPKALNAQPMPPPGGAVVLPAQASEAGAELLVALVARHKPLVVHCKIAAYDVYVGRDSAGRPADAPRECAWGNPFSSVKAKQEGGMGDVATRTAVYLQWVLSQPQYVRRARSELSGRVLGCWCVPRYCHGWVLAAVANCTDAELCEVCAPYEGLAPGDVEPPPVLVEAARRITST